MTWRDWIDPTRVGWLRLLLGFVPAALIAWVAEAPALAQFALASLAIIPLAGLIGEATEALAFHLGPGIGGLLNATFGNAAELIIALFALFRGLDDVVKASLTGSILGNLLLVMGASVFAGGLRFPIQRFEKTAAGAAATLMVLAAVGMVIPAIFHRLVSPSAVVAEHKLSLTVSVVLILAYVLNLVFSLVTHKNLYNPRDEDPETTLHPGVEWGRRKSTIILIVATALVALMSEVLVAAVEEASRTVGLTQVFVGVIVVAIVGNAAEHSTAVLMALKDKMDLSVGIALGSASQIALFVTPLLVLVSYARLEPMDLLFTPMEVLAIILAVIVARMVAEDGESNWLEGAMLLMVYVVLGLAFFFLPESAGRDPIPPKAASMERAHGGQ
ncbi:MAG: calcium/proton exchanger [Planctomycetaceae bacterium]|nr:calcium/proton exchanger [Planctomycetaceae bacterium]MBV8556046.1 calcium/proton exchanger [Planctomycetaceae bacterium]